MGPSFALDDTRLEFLPGEKPGPCDSVLPARGLLQSAPTFPTFPRFHLAATPPQADTIHLLPIATIEKGETSMNPTRASVLAALVAALGLTAMSPAFAAGPDHQRPGDGGRMLEFRRGGADGAFRFAEFTCGPRAADRIEQRLDRMGERLDLTTEQQKLFEDFRTSALTAQTNFADQCDDIRPGATADAGRTDLVQRLEQRLKFDEARLTAMTELLPQFKTFYESLTDEQKRELMPRRGFMRGMVMPGKGLPHHQVPPAPAAAAPGDDLGG
jgi:hypothetical protein